MCQTSQAMVLASLSNRNVSAAASSPSTALCVALRTRSNASTSSWLSPGVIRVPPPSPVEADGTFDDRDREVADAAALRVGAFDDQVDRRVVRTASLIGDPLGRTREHRQVLGRGRLAMFH